MTQENVFLTAQNLVLSHLFNSVGGSGTSDGVALFYFFI